MSPREGGTPSEKRKERDNNIQALIEKGQIYHNLDILALKKYHSNGIREKKYKCLIFQRKAIQELCLENSDRGNLLGNYSGDTSQRQLKFSVVRLQTLGNRKVKLGFVFCVRQWVLRIPQITFRKT